MTGGGTLGPLLLGAIATASATAGLFFLRYWLSTRDRFFLLFAASFFIEAANRVEMAFSPGMHEAEPLNYAVRLLAYALILLAIWDKNRSP
ncbi:DUF5985 family protein [Aquabacterium sp. J223]|uniref:DUF5985 family protein n=1 Tax=Aquabacterium sp. J223 TaxID=2898431 RepID=UPI0021ADAC0C|nr:DUF5985 family protein [Aquabacterium sp. J223]UUX94756.1 DUF5985 family protein [Aquabacterium sp. J223]